MMDTVFLQRFQFTGLFFVFIFSMCSASKSQKQSTLPAPVFENPVIPSKLPDPTIIRAADGTFYLYATESKKQVPIWKSKNLIDWTFVGPAFDKDARPDFLKAGGIWAPEINFIGGKYVLYYSMSIWGGHWTAGVGVAIADTPEGPFKDLGKLFDSKSIDVENSIDPSFFCDGDRIYILWGSFFGIYAIELSSDGLSLKSGAEKVKIAGTAYEGSYVYKKDGMYYFFGSIGSCCEGQKSTYQTICGRSKSFLGPYLNKKGESLIDNKHELLIGSNSDFVGNGHNAQIVHDDAGNDWMFYHGFINDAASVERGRVLLLSQLKWDHSGWPYVETQSPQKKAVAPIFYK